MSGCKFDCRAEVVVLACKVVVGCGMVDDEILGVVRAASQEEVGLDHTNVVVPVMPEEGGLWVGKTLALSVEALDSKARLVTYLEKMMIRLVETLASVEALDSKARLWQDWPYQPNPSAQYRVLKPVP